MQELEKLWLPQKNVEDFSKIFTKLTDGIIEQGDADFTTYRNASGLYSRNYIAAAPKKSVSEIINLILAGAKNGKPDFTTFTEEILGEDAKAAFCLAGFEILPIQQHGMVYERGREPAAVKDPHIERIGMEELSAWTYAMLEGFREENKPREDVLYEALVQSPDNYFLAYRVNGEIAGTALFYLTDDYPGITEVAVPKENRGQGIATKLLQYMLCMVDEMDLPGAVLQASPMGMPVYERLGFRKVSNICTVQLTDR